MKADWVSCGWNAKKYTGPMSYEYIAIPEDRVPRAAHPLFQHALDIYAGETNKVVSVWRTFRDEDLAYRPHPRSSTVADIMKHQLLSERRFFAEFLGAPEPAASAIPPADPTVDAYARRMAELAAPRLDFLAARDESWWLGQVSFFDVQRERIWVFWRRVLHTAHHRTQLTVYLRLLDRAVPSTYGPTADVTWKGADPTLSVEAADRK
jgi:uncharacterized damage-inducible protein DinB